MDREASLALELTVGLGTLVPILAKMGLLADELRMLSKLMLEGRFSAAEVGFRTVLAAPAKLGMCTAMLVAMLSREGAAEGAGEAGGTGGMSVEPLMEAAASAKEGMLVAMMSETPARVG